MNVYMIVIYIYIYILLRVPILHLIEVEKMNRTEMIFQIQRNIKKKNPDMEIPKNQIGLMVDGFIEMIKDELLTNGEVTITGLFTIQVLSQSKRKFYDAFRGQFYEKVPSKRLRVKTGSTLKSLLNTGADNSV